MIPRFLNCSTCSMDATHWDVQHWICDEASVTHRLSFGHVEFKGKNNKSENDRHKAGLPGRGCHPNCMGCVELAPRPHGPQ